MRPPFAAFILLLGIILSQSPSAKACVPRPDYWFAERYQFGPVELPESIVLVQSPPDVAQGNYQIINRSDLPIYILPMDARPSLVATTEPSVTGEGLSDEESIEEILLLDQAPGFATFIIETGEMLQLDNQNFTELIPYIEERNILEYSRPHFVYLPITQRGEFLMVFDDQLITVPFTISYALNENFSPEICGEVIEATTQQEVAFAEESNNNILIGTIAFCAIILFTLGAIIWIRKPGTP